MFAAINEMTIHSLVPRELGAESCLDMDYYTADQILNKRNPDGTGLGVELGKRSTSTAMGIELVATQPSNSPMPEMGDGADIFHRLVYSAAEGAWRRRESKTREYRC